MASTLPPNESESALLGPRVELREAIMKISFRSTFAIALLTMLAPAAASAQMTEPMKFTTTFPFKAGRVNFAPGTYMARPLDGDSSVICIQPEHGGKTALLVGIGESPRKDPAKSEVTFKREGSQLVLKSLWDESDGQGVDIITVRAHVNAN
jgi:hypothetical protein